jgi:hypothetical protein
MFSCKCFIPRQSGFYSEGIVWVACVNMSKQIANERETGFEKLCLLAKTITWCYVVFIRGRQRAEGRGQKEGISI